MTRFSTSYSFLVMCWKVNLFASEFQAVMVLTPDPNGPHLGCLSHVFVYFACISHPYTYIFKNVRFICIKNLGNNTWTCKLPTGEEGIWVIWEIHMGFCESQGNLHPIQNRAENPSEDLKVRKHKQRHGPEGV